MRSGLRLLVAAFVLLIAGVVPFRPAAAQNLSTRVFRPIGCTISATPIAFGNYDVNALVSVVALGSVSYDCYEGSGSVEVGKRITIQISAGSSGTYEYRYMQFGYDQQLRYNLYLDSNFRKVWGDGSRGTDDFSERARLSGVQVIPVYGRVFERQDVSAGSYMDSVHVTILF